MGLNHQGMLNVYTWSKSDISADGFGELVMARMVRIVSVAGLIVVS